LGFLSQWWHSCSFGDGTSAAGGQSRANPAQLMQTNPPGAWRTFRSMTVSADPRPLTLQMLAWLAERPRTYAETMEAWRTSCPRLSIWEDALADRLVRVVPIEGFVGQRRSGVVLTPEGRSLLGLVQPS
jgi:hypothetical protein